MGSFDDHDCTDRARNFREHDRQLVLAATVNFAPIVAALISREPGNMIGALEVLKRSHGEPMPPQLQASAISTGDGGGFMRLFTSHPLWIPHRALRSPHH